MVVSKQELKCLTKHKQRIYFFELFAEKFNTISKSKP